MDSQNSRTATTSFSATMLYVVCLVVGLLIGYLVRGNAPRGAAPGSNASQSASGQSAAMPQQMPTLEQLKAMADKQAAPLLQQLKADPNNPKLLFQIGTLYEAAHQFKDATAYFDKSLAVAPKDISVLSEKASCLYYMGDVDSAVTVLNTALQYSPNDSRILFNLGMIRWRSKGDAKGAIELWQKLLKSNPKLDNQKRAQVEGLIKQVKSHPAMPVAGS